MKGFRKYIAPFAPDQSGAAAVFCELGGLVIILDAGGCAGNICGFDEPRWFGSRSAIFSAGLRDMDAILGRDDRLIEKIEKACRAVRGKFVALIGTPVPAVIGTDYKALKKIIEKKTGIPVLAIDTDGMEWYDIGVRKATTALFATFAREGDVLQRRIGILGATPLDVGWPDGGKIGDYYKKIFGCEAWCYGMGSGLEEIKMAAGAEKNIVVAPAALEAARYLKERYGTPYETGYPLGTLPMWEEIKGEIPRWSGRRILIVHQQMLANALREEILKQSAAEVTVASWFSLDAEWKQEGDVHLKEEDEWMDLVRKEDYDLILCDELFFRAVPDFGGSRRCLPHFAVSGKGKI